MESYRHECGPCGNKINRLPFDLKMIDPPCWTSCCLSNHKGHADVGDMELKMLVAVMWHLSQLSTVVKTVVPNYHCHHGYR